MLALCGHAQFDSTKNILYHCRCTCIARLILWGISELVQHYRHKQQGEELAEAIAKDNEAEYQNKKIKEELALINQQMKDSISVDSQILKLRR